jgi:hypothetical protein
LPDSLTKNVLNHLAGDDVVITVLRQSE